MHIFNFSSCEITEVLRRRVVTIVMRIYQSLNERHTATYPQLPAFSRIKKFNFVKYTTEFFHSVLLYNSCRILWEISFLKTFSKIFHPVVQN